MPLDPHRADNIATFLAHARLVHPKDMHGVTPASLRALRLVHTDDYLASVNDARVLGRILGGDVPEYEVDQLLAMQRLHAGGTRQALRMAIADGGVVFHLGGGMHHAWPSNGHGFCLFNDIAVAIAEARLHGFKENILVIDCDIHDGDGTRACFREDATVHTYSVHNEDLDTQSAVESTQIALRDSVTDEAYLAALQGLPALLARFRPSCVIYVAGADPAHDDRLGNWNISDRGMLARDRYVMACIGERPCAVVLGGGYGAQAWRYTARFIGDFMRKGRTLEPPHTPEITLARMRHLRRQNDPVSTEFAFTEEEIFGDLGGPHPPSRFLDFYSMHALELVFERYGIFDRLRTLGYSEPSLQWTLGQPLGDTLRIFGDPGALVAEVCLRRDRRTLPGFELLYVEWLLLQHPRGQAKRGLLPGQRHPGLGMLAEAIGLFVMVCERLHLDGLAFVPMHHHLAAIGSRYMRFISPEGEAVFRAIERGEHVAWKPTPMVLPLTDNLIAHLASN